MGSNVESGGGEKMKSPLYSNGTSEMDSSKIVGAVEGPKSAPACDTSNATVHSFTK